jgi:hypothetical protein
MAKAEIYARYKGKDAAWSGPFGDGSSVMTDRSRGTDNSDSHAERVAWREAISKDNKANIDAWYAGSNKNFADDGNGGKPNVQIKIAVDQIVCPSCQAWIVTTALKDLGTLACAAARKVELFVEVKSAGSTVVIGVTRNSPWSLKVAQKRQPDLSLAA